jgi:hypothetical protein
MKVWCVPVNFPNPEKEPKQAEAARRFMSALPGLKGLSMERETGMMVLAFTELDRARSAKWKLEEFTPFRMEIIEGIMSEDGKRIDLHRVYMGE